MSKFIDQIVTYLRKNIVSILLNVTHVIELAIASYLGIMVMIWSLKMLGGIPAQISASMESEGLHELLSYCFNLIIIVEFIRVLIKHSMGNVLEVLIFALARGIIVDHEDSLAVLISIACIALLMVLRRYTLLDEDK